MPLRPLDLAIAIVDCNTHELLREVGLGPSHTSAILAFNRPSYVLLLNPDTFLPSSTLQDMLAFVDARPKAGATGCSWPCPTALSD